MTVQHGLTQPLRHFQPNGPHAGLRSPSRRVLHQSLQRDEALPHVQIHRLRPLFGQQGDRRRGQGAERRREGQQGGLRGLPHAPPV